VNLCSRNSPYSLNCHVGSALVFRMLCRITQSSDARRTESVSVIDHEQTMGVSSRVLDQKQQDIFGYISLFWSVELQGQPEQLNRGDHNWLIQTPVSTVQRGMLMQPDADTCTPGHTHTLYIHIQQWRNFIFRALPAEKPTPP